MQNTTSKHFWLQGMLKPWHPTDFLIWLKQPRDIYS